MLQDRVGIPSEKVQSYTSALLAAYGGASVVCSPLAGLLADRLSTRQAPFLAGLTALLVATIMLFWGKTLAILIVARLLQGVSAAFVWTIGLALCLETVGPENLGKTIGSVCQGLRLTSTVLISSTDFQLHFCRQSCGAGAGRCAL